MADYDLKSDVQSLVHQARASLTATPTKTSVDLLDYGSCTFLMYAGAGGITFSGTNRVDYIVEESDNDSTWSVAPDDALILDPTATAPGGTGIARSLIVAKGAADTTIPTVGYRGKKRYARCTPTFAGTHGAGTTVGVDVVKGHPYHKPVGQTSIADYAIAAQ